MWIFEWVGKKAALHGRASLIWIEVVVGMQEVVAGRLTEWEGGAGWALALVILEIEFGREAWYLLDVDL